MPHRNPKGRKATLLLISSLTVMSGASIAPALPEIGRAFAGVEGSELKVRLLLTMPGLAIAVTAPLAGMIVDRIGRRPLLLFSLALFTLTGTSGLYLPSLNALLMGRMLLGLAVAGMMTSATTLVADFYEGAERSAILGAQGATAAAGGILFLTGGGLLADIHWRMPFLIYTTSLVAIPLVLRFVGEPARVPRHLETPLVVTHLGRPGIRTLLIIYTFAFLGMIAFYMVPVQLPFHLAAGLGASNTAAGIAIATSTLFGAIASLQYGRLRRRFSPLRLMSTTLLLMGMGFCLVYLAESYSIVILAMMFNGTGLGLMMPNLNNWLVDSVPAQLRGRALGGMSTALFLGQFFSPIVTSPIILHYSSAAAFGIAGAMLVTAGAAMMITVVILQPRNQR